MKAHRTDLISLGFGLVFLAGAGLWLTAQVVPLDAATVGWFVTGSLVLLGAVGLVHTLTRHRRAGD